MKRLVLLLVGVSVSSLAYGADSSPAPGSAKVLEDKKAPTYNEIERGFHIGINAGPFFMINAPTGVPDDSGCRPEEITARNNRGRPFSIGQSAQVELGYDFGERVSAGLSLTSTAHKTSADFLGFSKCTAPASGDFSVLIPGLTLRVNLVGFNDSQGVKRTWIYVRGGGGFALFAPAIMFPSPNVFINAGVGVQYFTRLRHFSIGLEATGNFFALTGTIGFAITPSLRYAF